MAIDNPLKNLFAITDLRNRVLFTLAMLGVYRIGNHVPTPGVNTEALNVMAEDHVPYLSRMKPAMPEELDLRARDITRPLIAIADLVEGEWPEKARAAIVNLRNRMSESDLTDDKLLLLRDIRRVMGIKKEIPSQVLVERLQALSDSPWERLTTRKLADMLREFSEYPGGPRIKPKQIRKGQDRMRCYMREQFRDPWKRYIRRIKE